MECFLSGLIVGRHHVLFLCPLRIEAHSRRCSFIFKGKKISGDNWKKYLLLSQVWQHTLLMLVVGQLGQEDDELNTGLLGKLDPVSSRKTETKPTNNK